MRNLFLSISGLFVHYKIFFLRVFWILVKLELVGVYKLSIVET